MGIIPAPAIQITRPGVSNVILTSEDHFRLSSRMPDYPAADGSLGLLMIAAGLRTQGFDRVSITNPSANGGLDLAHKQRAIVDTFKKMGAAEDGSIIGITATSNGYYKFEPLARLLGNAFPNAQLIAGGPAFVREKINGFADPVEQTLRKGLVHAIQVGRSGTFTDFVVKHRGQMDQVEGPGFYRLDPATKDIVGHGVGRQTQLDSLPFRVTGSDSIGVLFGDTCGNGCAFCSAPKSSKPLFTIDQIVRGLSLAAKQHNVAAINLCDPNPIGPRHIDFYEEAFRAIDRRVHRTAKWLYIDPASLVDDAHFERVLKLAHESVFWSIYAGRDVVLESQARVIGAKFQGRLKDQAMLVAEKSALMRFIIGLKTFHPKLAEKRPRELKISYIITPFDTDETGKALFEDFREFTRLADPTMHINSNTSPLVPYPGTLLRRNLAHLIDLEETDYRGIKGDTVTPWKAEAGPGLDIMRFMLQGPQENQ